MPAQLSSARPGNTQTLSKHGSLPALHRHPTSQAEARQVSRDTRPSPSPPKATGGDIQGQHRRMPQGRRRARLQARNRCCCWSRKAALSSPEVGMQRDMASVSPQASLRRERPRARRFPAPPSGEARGSRPPPWGLPAPSQPTLPGDLGGGGGTDSKGPLLFSHPSLTPPRYPSPHSTPHSTPLRAPRQPQDGDGGRG